ncbi:MAG: acyl-CoA dehydrogenase family protein [Hyphomicrobiales bacterium]
MQIHLNETQRLLRDSLRDLLERELPFDRVRELERSGEWDASLWATLRSSGWLALPFPRESGGEGGSLVETAVLIEELARRAALVPFVETVASALVLAPGHPEAVRRVIAGEATIAPALFGADDSPRTGAEVVGGKLSGEKQSVDYPAASLHLISARMHDAVGLGLVSSDDPGVSVCPVAHIGRSPKARVTYQQVPVSITLESAELETLLGLGTLLSAVQCLGSAQQAFDMTVAYVANRVQFGRPIGTFQAVQHECADMATLLEITRFLVYQAVAKFAAGAAQPDDIAGAKAWAARTAVDVTMMSHQLHGGIGVTEEYDLNFFSRRARDRALAWSTETECLRVVAEGVDAPEAWV